MAKKIRFPLEMKDGAKVRSVEELREHFSTVNVLTYVHNGKLVTWLRDRYVDDLADAVEHLDVEDTELPRKVSEIFDVPYHEEDAENLQADMERSQRLEMLRAYTNEERYIVHIDDVAFDQDGLYDLLDEGKNEIYLCGDKFSIPLAKKGITYIGVNNPIAVIDSKEIVNWNEKNIILDSIRFDEKYNELLNRKLKEKNSCKKIKELERYFSEYKIDHVITLGKELIKNDDGKAMYILGRIYEMGYTDILQDYEKAKKLFVESYKKGYLPSLVRLYLPWSGSPYISKEELLSKFEDLEAMAAEGEMFASEEWARCLVNYNYLLGKENQYEKAVTLFGKAPKASGLYNLALRYKNGQGVLMDDTKAFSLFLQSADMGYSPSEYEIGKDYLNGWGCQIDNEKGFVYLDRAEKHGNKYAIAEVANCYVHGLGVKVDEKKAFAYYMKGANKGIELCISNLGWCYEYGHGVDIDKDEALRWYKISAETEKNGYSNYHIGNIYYQKHYGNDENIKIAGRYLRKAVQMGNYDALNLVNQGGMLFAATGFTWEEISKFWKKFI